MSEASSPTPVAVASDQRVAQWPPAPNWSQLLHDLHGLLRFVYVSNPFYVISAAFVFAGLRISFDTSGATFGTSLLLAALAGYALLLAVTAALIVRLGGVWDDARSLLLLVVLILLALSVTFDETLTRDRLAGAAHCAIGFALAVLLSEWLLRVLRMRLPGWYRLSYYLSLALFFGYPVALAFLNSTASDVAVSWILFGFSAAQGIAFLALTPAVSSGAAYVKNNGTPWPWPLYPWSLFFVLGFAVCARAYYLCVSMHFLPGSDSIFSLFFLAPFFFAIAILLVEASRGSERWLAHIFAASMPVVILRLTLASPGPGSPAWSFYRDFTSTTGGTPLFWVVALSCLYYAYASFRKCRWGLDGFTIALFWLAVVAPRTRNLATTVEPQLLPLACALAVQSLLAMMRGDARRWIVVAALVALIADVELRSTFDPAVMGRFVSTHVLIGLLLAIGAVPRLRYGDWAQYIAAALLLVCCLAAILRCGFLAGGVSEFMVASYPLAVSGVAFAYGHLVDRRLFRLLAAFALAAWLIVYAARVYRVLQQRLPGLDKLLFGALFFAVAALISWLKATRRLLRSPVPASPTSAGELGHQ